MANFTPPPSSDPGAKYWILRPLGWGFYMFFAWHFQVIVVACIKFHTNPIIMARCGGRITQDVETVKHENFTGCYFGWFYFGGTQNYIIFFRNNCTRILCNYLLSLILGIKRYTEYFGKNNNEYKG